MKAKSKDEIKSYYSNLELFFLKQKNRLRQTGQIASNKNYKLSSSERHYSSNPNNNQKLNTQEEQAEKLLAEAELLRRESKYLEAFQKYIKYYHSKDKVVSEEICQLIFIHGVLSNYEKYAKEGYNVKYYKTIRSNYSIAPDIGDFVRDMNLFYEHGMHDLALQETQELYNHHPEHIELKSVLTKLLLKKSQFAEAANIASIKKKK